ncbi:MAG: hypothetical protein J6K96_09520 [Treponema sp.]|nr:hypothetical protein [Treponema sp.]
MTVEKKEIIELQKDVARKIQEMHLSPNPDSARIFDLNMLDSNLSLFLLAAEFKEDPLKLSAGDKCIIDALKEFRSSSARKTDAETLSKELAASAREILDLLEQAEDRLEGCTETVFCKNIKARLDFAYELLRHIESLQDASKRTVRKWQTEEIPLPLSSAATLLGKARSEKKAKAARENGKKGGRPSRAAPKKSAVQQKKTAAKQKEADPASLKKAAAAKTKEAAPVQAEKKGAPAKAKKAAARKTSASKAPSAKTASSPAKKAK